MSERPADRVLRLEVEVPGSPEEVWEAVATGPGISAWFVPAVVDGRVGGRMELTFGPGLVEQGEITAWEPPHRFRYGAPPGSERTLAFEWLVEAQAGGTCLVRLVNSGFGEGEDWDREYDGLANGWPMFLDNLRLFRTHFPGQRAASVIVTSASAGLRGDVWPQLVAALGASEAAVGDRVALEAEGAPRLAGVVERAVGERLTLLLDDPGPGVAFLSVEGHGDPSYASVFLYLFGDGAAELAARDDPRWRAWLAERFPAPEPGA